MKRLILFISILIGSLETFSQTNKAIQLTANYINLPAWQMNGGGYSISYQQQVSKWLHVEMGGGYEISMSRVERDYTLNNVRLLNLYYHHAAYYLYGVPLSKIKLGSKMSFDLYAGPVVSYQSNVYDKYHYQILDESGSVSNSPDIIYENNSQEGAFIGGIAGARMSLFISPKWTINAAANIKGIIKAKTTIETGIGVSYWW